MFLNNLLLVILSLHFLALSLLVNSEYPSKFEKVIPTDCIVGQEYFDISLLQCLECPPNSFTSDSDLLNCKCAKEFRYVENNGGGRVKCEKCTDPDEVQSLDGFACILCNGCESCSLSDSFRSDTYLDGSYRNESECITCAENAILVGNACVSSNLVDENVIAEEPNDFSFIVNNDNVIISSYFTETMVRAFRLCNRQNVTACNALANMCVLNLYRGTLNKLDACKAYETKLDKVPEAMPKLTYRTSLDEYKRDYLDSNDFISLRYIEKCKPNNLNFFSTEYDLNGNLIGLDAFDISQLQFCGPISSSDPFSSTNLVQKCSIKVESLFKMADLGNRARLFEIYLKYGNGSSLLPVPIIIKNSNSNFFYKRFLLIDAVGSRAGSDESSVGIRYAKSIKIDFSKVKDKANGIIYPPIITIEYGYSIRKDDINKSIDFTFTIEYEMDITIERKYFFIVLGVLCGLAFLWSCYKIYAWNRRSSRFALDVIFLFKFMMFLIGSAANAMLLTVVLFSLYWLTFYRTQTFAFMFLPTQEQERIFRIFVFVSFGLKLADMIYLIFVQSSYEIFLVDWEQPKQAENALKSQYDILPPIKSTAPGKTEIKLNDMSKYELEKQNKISCWRTLFVANEWNELQVYRKINTTVQLVFVLILLKVVDLESLSLRDCSIKLNKDTNEYNAPFSITLRVAIASIVFIAIGLFQLILHYFIYSRCIEDKISNFIDFCSVSNISMFILTHSQFGYYIHGRSPMGYADISMQRITEALLTEKNSMTAKRGLQPDSDIQTFSIAISERISNQYAKIMIPLRDRQIKRINLNSNEFEKKMIAYTQMNRFLIALLENSLRDMKYLITDRNLVESILDFEFKTPMKDAYFYPDNTKAFTETIFYGKEMTLFAFDLLLFLFVDVISSNYLLSIFIVYVVNQILKRLRADLGKRNLSRKTLVDKRFLI